VGVVSEEFAVGYECLDLKDNQYPKCTTIDEKRTTQNEPRKTNNASPSVKKSERLLNPFCFNGS